MKDSTELQEGPVQPCASISPPDDLLDSLIEGFQVIDFDFRYLYVNAAVVEHGKTTREALLGRTMQEAYPGIDQTEMFGVLRDCMQRRVRRSMENEFRYPDGSTGWFELRFGPVAEGVAILSLDITERKRSELALRRALHALETLCHCNLTLADARDEGGFVRDICNLMVEAGEQPAAWIRLDSVDSADGSAPDGGSTVRAERTERAAGTPMADLPQETRPILAGGKVIGELGVVARRREGLNADEHRLVDEVARNLGYGLENLRARVTHVRTQQQLEGAQRLEAVGRLAGGVAHDFNNLLSVILAYAGFIAEQVGSEPKIVEDVEQVQLAAERAAALTRQLLAFSRRQVLEPRVLNVNDTVRGLEPMLRRTLGEDIEVEVHTAEDLGNTVADPTQLEQVIMNLVVNARDAMAGGGRLTIETRNVELDASYANEHMTVEPGAYVQLSVSDTGAGMDAETRSHVFEPFFSTKEAGKGTGLGLSTVYGIVKQTGGNVWVYSEPGQGTTFKVYLPRVDAPVAAEPRRASASSPTGHETVLVVEDEPAVRRVAERVMRQAGYRVLSAADGREALSVFDRQKGAVDLLLTDVVMPSMGGRELVDRLRERRPDLKVIFTSGYADSALLHRGVLDSSTRFLNKPFTAEALMRKARRVLDGDE